MSADPSTLNGCADCNYTGMRLTDKGAATCACRERPLAQRLEAIQIPARFAQCSFKNYFPKHPTQYAALAAATQIVDEYPAVDRGLLLMGGVGIGKTHLAAATLRELVTKKRVGCLFYELGALLKKIQESYSPIAETSELRILSQVYEAETLVLDELGATVPTNWVRDTLYQIINRRYNDRKLTIITTNYLDDAATPRVPLLEERIGIPLRSRLYEMCRTLYVTGQDYRRQVDQRGGLTLTIRKDTLQK